MKARCYPLFKFLRGSRRSSSLFLPLKLDKEVKELQAPKAVQEVSKEFKDVMSS